MTEPVADGAGEQTPESDDTGSGQPAKPGADQQQAILRKLRKAEKELAQFRSIHEEAEKGKLTESERYKSEAERYKTEAQQAKDALRQAKIQHRLEAEATKAGALSAEAAIKLADLSTVDIDDDGNVTGIDAVITALKTQHKFLFGSPMPTNGVGHASGNPASGNPLKSGADRIKQMSPAEFAAYAKQFGG